MPLHRSLGLAPLVPVLGQFGQKQKTQNKAVSSDPSSISHKQDLI